VGDRRHCKSYSVSMLCCEGCMNHDCYPNDWEGDQRRGHAFSRFERPSATDKPESPHSMMRWTARAVTSRSCMYSSEERLVFNDSRTEQEILLIGFSSEEI